MKIPFQSKFQRSNPIDRSAANLVESEDILRADSQEATETFDPQAYDGELAFYDGLANSSRFVTGMTAAGTVALAALTAGTAMFTAAAISPGIAMVGLGIGTLAAGAGAYKVGTLLSDAVGYQGEALDKNFPERGEALARTSLTVGLNAISGGVGGAIGTAAVVWAEGSLTEGYGWLKHKFRKTP